MTSVGIFASDDVSFVDKVWLDCISWRRCWELLDQGNNANVIFRF